MAAEIVADAKTSLHVELVGALNSLYPEWDQIKSNHPGWLAKFRNDQPIYALPDETIDKLARPYTSTIGPLLTSRDVAAEEAFGKLCDRMQYVGILRDEGIRFALFRKPASTIDPETAARLNWNKSHLPQVVELLQKADEANDRLLGVAGWLMTEPAYLNEIDELKQIWSNLSKDERPSLPLERPRQEPSPIGRRLALSVVVGQFVRRVTEFLDRWSLVRLATWDLPEPQGPMLPDLPGADALNRPPDAIRLYLPFHYPLIGNDDLQQQIAKWQRRKLVERGISPSLSGLKHHHLYAQFFRMMHLERCISSRFLTNSKRSLRSHIIQAAAATLQISVDRIIRIRTEINQCRKGDREKVKSLRA